MQDIYEEKNEIELEDYEIVYQTCDYQVLMTSQHFHDAIEIIYVIEGEFFVTVNDKEYTLKPGRMVFINAKEIHSVYTVGPGFHRSVAIKFLPEITGSGSQSFPAYYDLLKFQNLLRKGRTRKLEYQKLY